MVLHGSVCSTNSFALTSNERGPTGNSGENFESKPETKHQKSTPVNNMAVKVRKCCFSWEVTFASLSCMFVRSNVNMMYISCMFVSVHTSGENKDAVWTGDLQNQEHVNFLFNSIAL